MHRTSSSSDCLNKRPVDLVLKPNPKRVAADSRHRSSCLLQDLKRISTAFTTRSSSCQVCLLITCVTLIAFASPANGQQLQQAPQLPTVIVRGFLNYRTTVDGTVLLFTPDAGQSQPSASLAAGQPTKTSQMARLEPTSSAPHPARSLVYTETLAHAIEPTSVLLEPPPESPRTVHMMDSFRQSTGALAVAGDSPFNTVAAQANEWRPIQSTPPLKLVQTSTLKPNTDSSSQEIVVASQPVKPSVQADDIAESQPVAPKLAKEQVGDTPIVPKQSENETRTNGRFRRPSLGFNGQGLRPRVPGTDGAVSPSLQARSRPELDQSSSSSPPNSINGIRRPGLASSARSQMAPASEPATNVSNAFQNRLSNASTRLKNRFKHRQPSATTQSPVSSSAIVVVASSGSEQKERNNLVAPESLLDVASSIEQTTSAARSQALAPQSNREQLSSSGPAVGSDEAMTSLASSSSGGLQSQSNSQPDNPTAEATNNQQADQPETVIVPVVASNVETGPLGGLMEPISAEQQAGLASLSRAGEQHPTRAALNDADSGPRVISGQLLSGSLSSGPLNMDNMFLSDQPIASPTPMENHSASEPAPSHMARATSNLHKQMKPFNSSSSNMNGKLNGWLGQHHNKFVPRPPSKPSDQPNLSHQLASNLQQLAPAPIVPFANQSIVPSSQYETSNNNNNNNTQAEASSVFSSALNANNSSESVPSGNLSLSDAQLAADQMNMQTVTRTYSTIMETTRTRIVPMQVDSSTGIYTITEDFLMTKMMTAYQTLPANAVFLLADQQLNTRAPYEVFDSSRDSAELKQKAESVSAPSVAAPAIVSAPIETQEQPISLDNSPKTANNWLHDFSHLDGGLTSNPLTNDFSSSTSAGNQQDQQQAMLALLEQRAREANLAPNFSLMSSGDDQLDQLASQLDPTSLLADGAINIPDLNNPLVLAAAIQNPQLAAVILAAQQLKLKRQQQLQQKPLLQQQQQQQQPHQFNQLQPSFSTSFSTTIRPSTYTARDTMYTTRLVSFRDGRTVRTRTVSEPGSVVEQVLTTMVTETIPITITIKPTGLIGPGPQATSLPSGISTGALSAQSNQATINNALFATQLANILSRRQQQLQTSFQSPSLGGLAQGLSSAAAATPQQLLALQQYIGQQQKRQQQAQQQSPQLQQAQQQFQPNFQQLLQSMDSSSASATNSSLGQVSRKAGSVQQNSSTGQPAQQQHLATPSLQQPPKSVVSSVAPMNVLSGPITTTLTSIQTKTYTVHNAFKTIFRTITSTILIPTVLNAGSTLMPTFG